MTNIILKKKMMASSNTYVVLEGEKEVLKIKQNGLALVTTYNLINDEKVQIGTVKRDFKSAFPDYIIIKDKTIVGHILSDGKLPVSYICDYKNLGIKANSNNTCFTIYSNKQQIGTCQRKALATSLTWDINIADSIKSNTILDIILLLVSFNIDQQIGRSHRRR